uniref:Uncharacterized protein n=1 Tax=Caenorhabditis tropicalis TaxID=1561998 RepID=A0A1I7U249_9PELO
MAEEGMEALTEPPTEVTMREDLSRLENATRSVLKGQRRIIAEVRAMKETANPKESSAKRDPTGDQKIGDESSKPKRGDRVAGGKDPKEDQHERWEKVKEKRIPKID